MKKKLAIITSHPIQYNAPLFSLLHQSSVVQPKIFYTWSQTQQFEKYDPGFGRLVEWDIPLLKGYDYLFVPNISKTPGTHHFKGLINPTLNREIEEWGADAVLVFGWAFQSHLKCIRYFHGKKIVLFRGDSTLLDDTGGVKSFIRKLFLRWVYSHIDVALYVGTNNKNYFIRNGLLQNQLVYAPHAIDNHRFQQDADKQVANALQMRHNLGFTDKDVILLFAGKLEQKKNPFLLLRLMKKIAHPNLKLLFVGNGKLEQSLKQAAAADKRVVFLDFQNQKVMPVIYRVADIFVLPSAGPGETWGLSLNEAMACSKPVVATDKAGGAIDLIQPDSNGLIIENDNTLELENLIILALQDKSKLNEMGRQSQKKADTFCYQTTVNAINNLLALQ